MLIKPKEYKDYSPVDILNLSAQRTPMSPADYHRQSPQQQSVFLCVIMQPAAFVCVICAICGRITRKSTLSISTNETPKSPADLADYRRQNHETTLTTICLSLRDNAACCVPLRDLRYLRENNTQEYSINQHIQTPISLPLISQIYAEKYNCGKPYYISALKFTI